MAIESDMEGCERSSGCGNHTPAQVVAYLSPLIYARDLMNHAVLGRGLLDSWLDLAVLLKAAVCFWHPLSSCIDAAGDWVTDEAGRTGLRWITRS